MHAAAAPEPELLAAGSADGHLWWVYRQPVGLAHQTRRCRWWSRARPAGGALPAAEKAGVAGDWHDEAMELHDAPAGSAALQGLAAIAVDCADPPALAEFYARLLGAPWAVDDDGDAGVYAYDGPNIDCLRVPEPKTAKNRVHLDLRARDLDGAVAHALACGAVRAPDVYAGDAWVVLRDPEGNELCILRPRPGGALRWSP